MQRALLFIALVALCASCLQPRKWPLPELTVPGTPARIPTMFASEFPEGYLSDDGTYTKELPGAYSWARGFNYPNGWDALGRHVAGSIEQHGYQPYRGPALKELVNVPGFAPGTLGRGWLSNDRRFLVVLVNIAVMKDNRVAGINADDANYVIAIDDMTGYAATGETPPTL